MRYWHLLATIVSFNCSDTLEPVISILQGDSISFLGHVKSGRKGVSRQRLDIKLIASKFKTINLPLNLR